MKTKPILTDKSIDLIVALRGQDGNTETAQIVERALELYFKSLKLRQASAQTVNLDELAGIEQVGE